MSDGFWTSFNTYFWPGLFIFLGGLVVQIPTIIVALKTNRKLNDVKTTALATKNELSAQVDEVKAAALTTKEELSAKVDAVQNVAVRSKHEITQAFQAGERQGYVGGIEVGKQQSTGPGGVTDFNPLEK